MTQVEDLGQLATSFGQGLRALALTCDDLRSLWSRSNLHASRRKFFTVWPPNPSQRKLSDVHELIISQWNTGYVCLEMVFLRHACTCEETCQCVWPPNASLYASSTCVHLRLLAGPFGQGFRFLRWFVDGT